jgi:hypothetical protein
MNCRPLAVFVIALSGLVPAMQSANAGSPTYRHGTATATILVPVTIRQFSGGLAEVHGDRRVLRRQNTIIKYIDGDGMVTNANESRSRQIIIFDLP